MRKIILLVALYFALIGSIYAQHTVTGTVTDEEGLGIPGASILEKGTNNGVITDFDGNYKLDVSSGDAVLVFSFVGMKAIEENVNGRSSISVTMVTDAVGLDEVVVTALGIQREKKSLGYAMQEIGGADLVDAREPNLANTLSGKVSGLQIVRGAGGPAGSSKIILRGNNSLTGSNQPLVVVDGMPIDNFTDGAKVDMWGSGEGRDFGSGIGDLNPDDIESMSVLKGASAAALSRYH